MNVHAGPGTKVNLHGLSATVWPGDRDDEPAARLWRSGLRHGHGEEPVERRQWDPNSVLHLALMLQRWRYAVPIGGDFLGKVREASLVAQPDSVSLGPFRARQHNFHRP